MGFRDGADERRRGAVLRLRGLIGLSLSSLFLVYTGASIARVFFITAATFGALSLYGYTTKRDLSASARSCSWA